MWEELYHHSLKWFLYAEEISQGSDQEMAELCEYIFTKVIPRLLLPLETGYRSIQPRLIHGDMWAGNCSTNVATDAPTIYDGTSLYTLISVCFFLAKITTLSQGKDN